jgi:enterochelin esterase-like enzyme
MSGLQATSHRRLRRRRAGLAAVLAVALIGALVADTGQIRAASAPRAGSAPRAAAAPTRPPATSLRSAALAGTESFAIALPPRYASRTRRYPVIYVLHGLPAGPGSYMSLPIARMAATAAAAGHPSIVVAPQGARRGDRDGEWHDWGRGRDWETAVSSELVRYVDRHWRTIPDRRARAIIGMSAGGYGAMIIGLHHPESYAVVEAWSGYFQPTTPDGSAVLNLADAAADRAASAHSFVSCMAAMTPAARPYIGFYIGAQDNYRSFIADNRTLDRELTAAKVSHRFAIYPGAHKGSFWASHERDWLSDAVSHLARVVKAPGSDRGAVKADGRAAGCPTP